MSGDERCWECYGGDCDWFYPSAIQPENGPAFFWVIEVTDEGMFETHGPSELSTERSTFETIREAKAWCEEQERKAVEAVRKGVG